MQYTATYCTYCLATTQHSVQSPLQQHKWDTERNVLHISGMSVRKHSFLWAFPSSGFVYSNNFHSYATVGWNYHYHTWFKFTLVTFHPTRFFFWWTGFQNIFFLTFMHWVDALIQRPGKVLNKLFILHFFIVYRILFNYNKYFMQQRFFMNPHSKKCLLCVAMCMSAVQQQHTHKS